MTPWFVRARSRGRVKATPPNAESPKKRRPGPGWRSEAPAILKGYQRKPGLLLPT